MSDTPDQVIRMRDYGSQMRMGIHAQQVHDRIAQALKASQRVLLDFTGVEFVGETFLDRSLGALVAWHGATVLQSLVFTHCNPRVAASIGKALPRAGGPASDDSDSAPEADLRLPVPAKQASKKV
ncbi:MAG: hypothetical protein DMD91_25685 [Candidatus Rokuibacteriota bacterium]|nr:MAG: hypothetical protein DMD91_25685 [Candidatus Rokubacteria bacterium]